jgi:hypothetical protein
MVYWINDADEIVFVGGGWDDFARKNGAPDLSSDHIIGKYFWDFIGGAAKHLYRQIVANVRRGRPARIEYRNDSTTQDIHKELLISTVRDKFIQFETSTIRSLDRPYRDHGASPVISDIITSCSWCGRVKIGKSIWADADRAVNILSLFNNRPHLSISGGMCDQCYARITATRSKTELVVLTR